METIINDDKFESGLKLILEQIGQLDILSWEKLQKVETGDTLKLKKITKIIEEIPRLRRIVDEVEMKYYEISSSFSNTELLNEVEITITENALKESYLTLSTAFFEGVCTLDDIGKEIKIVTPYSEFTTQINSNKRLKARGQMREFYQKSDLLDGESVTFTKLEKGVFQISPNSYRYIQGEE